MTTKEIIALAVLLWFAFRKQPEGSSEVTLTITDPGFAGMPVVQDWPPQ